VDRLDCAGLPVLSIFDFSRHAAILREEIRAFQPDWVLVSSEDLSHTLLREAHRAAPDRLVYLAHTPQFFPFGPASWHRDEEATRIVRHAAAVVAIGHHTAGYIERHCGRPAEVIHPPIYGTPPYPNFSSFESGYVLMINPCAVKGLSIFLALAARFPKHKFAALQGWGTTSADRTAIGRQPNVKLLSTVKNIDEVLGQARLLLMPSLWYEGFGLIATEAMLRGLPVVASDSGGLVEAKEGTSFVIRVRGIEKWRPTFDEMRMPVPVLPEQDIGPWEEALCTLLTDRLAYEAESRRSREAGMRFVSSLHVEDFERLLLRLQRMPVDDTAALDRLGQLSPERRELLLRRLRQRGGR
jgi:glycosyltransferase involved in cell wall biosynthesis